MVPQAEGVFPSYSKIPGSLRYGADVAGPPVRFAHGRFVEYDGSLYAAPKVQYGDVGGVYVEYDRAIGSVTYGP